jgi:hypothetical protein
MPAPRRQSRLKLDHVVHLIQRAVEEIRGNKASAVLRGEGDDGMEQDYRVVGRWEN